MCSLLKSSFFATNSSFFSNPKFLPLVSGFHFLIVLVLLFSSGSLVRQCSTQQIADNHDNYFNSNRYDNRHLTSAGVDSDGIHQKQPNSGNVALPHPQTQTPRNIQKLLQTNRAIRVNGPQQRDYNQEKTSNTSLLNSGGNRNLKLKPKPNSIRELSSSVTPVQKVITQRKNVNQFSNVSQSLETIPNANHKGDNTILNNQQDFSALKNISGNNNGILEQNQYPSQTYYENQNIGQTEVLNPNLGFNQNQNYNQYPNFHLNQNYAANQNYDQNFNDDQIFSPEQKRRILNPISAFFQKLLQRLKYPNQNNNPHHNGNFEKEAYQNHYSNTSPYLTPPESQQYGVVDSNGNSQDFNGGYGSTRPEYGVPISGGGGYDFSDIKPPSEGGGKGTNSDSDGKPVINTGEGDSGAISPTQGGSSAGGVSGLPLTSQEDGHNQPTEEGGPATSKPDIEGYSDPRPTPGVEVIEQSDAEGIFIDVPEAPPPDVMPERGFVTSSTSTTRSTITLDMKEIMDLSDAWDIRNSVPGRPLIDYPVLFDIPQTNFSCEGRITGFYADHETRCQVFHRCVDCKDQPNIIRESFLCPNGTQFNQQNLQSVVTSMQLLIHVILNCDWWSNVNCPTSAAYFKINEELGVKNKDGNYYQLSAFRRPTLPKKEAPQIIPVNKRRPLPPELRSHHHHHHHEDMENQNTPIPPITGSEEERQRQEPQVNVTNFQSYPPPNWTLKPSPRPTTLSPTTTTSVGTRKPKTLFNPATTTSTLTTTSLSPTKTPPVVTAVYSDYFNDDNPFRNGALGSISPTGSKPLRRVKVKKQRLQLQQQQRQRQLRNRIRPRARNSSNFRQRENLRYNLRSVSNYDFDTSSSNEYTNANANADNANADENDKSSESDRSKNSQDDIEDNVSTLPRISSRIARVISSNATSSTGANNSNNKNNSDKKIVSYIETREQTISSKRKG